MKTMSFIADTLTGQLRIPPSGSVEPHYVICEIPDQLSPEDVVKLAALTTFIEPGRFRFNDIKEGAVLFPRR